MTSLHTKRTFWILTLTLLAGLGLALALPALARAGQTARDNPALTAGDIIYVAKTGDGSDGSSWAKAYTDLQDALTVTVVTSGDEIWVATGVYTPGTTVNDTFQLLDGVAIYGGFDPDNDADKFAERDWEAFPTVLSGDIDGNDTTDDNGVVTTTTNIAGANSYHVVVGNGVSTTATLDGFTITAGQADGGGDNNNGGGMYNLSGSPTLTDVTFSGNSATDNGGGMYNTDSSPTLTDVTISGNLASNDGGGMYNASSSSPLLVNVTLSGNSATNAGGGIYNQDSNPQLTNIKISGNHAATNGGGMYNNQSSSPELTNVTISGNRAAANGGGMYNSQSNPDVRNSILWNNQDSSGTGSLAASITNSSSTITLTHSLAQATGGSASWTSDTSFDDGGNNLDSDPLFIQAVNPASAPTTSGDLRLGASSPAINAGDNQYVTDVSTDLDGTPRIIGGRVDMGAYEFIQCPSVATLYVDQHVSTAGDGSSWPNATTSLQTALFLSGSCPGISEIWVAKGVYTPGITQADTFQLLDGVALYGGFDPSSGADEFDERDWTTYPTVLSGDIGGDDITDAKDVVTTTANISGTNSYHVVTGSGVDKSAELDGFTITAGQADGDGDNDNGGGMFNLYGDPTLAHITFSGNSAATGGGMYNKRSSPTLTDVTFSINSAENLGGGMVNFLNSYPELAQVTFHGNSAGAGGGMFNKTYGDPSLTDVTFSDNQADYGGGMYNTDLSNPRLTDVTFSGNSTNSEGYGGGMYNGGGSPELTNVTFKDNSADVGGGGMFNESSEPVLTNVSFSGNSADSGGGMYIYLGSPTLTNVTFSGNSAEFDGGGMYNNNSSPSVRNSILWNNQDSSGSGTLTANIYNLVNPDSTITLTLTHSLVQGSGGSASWTSFPGFVDGGNNLDTDPRFILDADPAAAPSTGGNLRLGPTSPAINAGDDQYVTGVTTDLDGEPRISGVSVDLGVYEFQCPIAATLYVDHKATGAGDGSSWPNAYPDLQQALSAASVSCGASRIWVATGVYTPGSTQADTFQLLDGISIYGGFDPASGAGEFAERDWQAFPSVLSGDIGGDDTTNANGMVDIKGANSYHVVTGSGVGNSAVLDGFIITTGQANGGEGDNYGGGMVNDNGDPTLTNLAFYGNYAEYGGGMTNVNNSSPLLTSVAFVGNSAATNGGGMYNDTSSPVLTNVSFSGNQAFENGGGMYNIVESSPVLINVTFSGNFAKENGGGMFNDISSSPSVHNSILWNNQDSSGRDSLTANIFNFDSIDTLTDSLVQGVGDDFDPLFIEPVDPEEAPTTSGNLRLAAGSPAINAGDNQYVTGVTTDLDGNPRIRGDIVDMGAYEFQAFYELFMPQIIR